MNSEIKRKEFDTAVSTILHREDEDRCWALYLSCMANPFADRMTFDDFMKKYGTRPNVQSTQKKAEPRMNKKQAEMQVEQAEKILHSFRPAGK